MKCYNCGHENPPKTTFCFKCASRLDIALFNQPSKGVFMAPQDEITRTKKASPRQGNSQGILWILLALAIGAVAYWLLTK